eukprot:Nk52_evm13s1401 gene=Nk52_evmTU13s1401
MGKPPEKGGAPPGKGPGKIDLDGISNLKISDEEFTGFVCFMYGKERDEDPKLQNLYATIESGTRQRFHLITKSSLMNWAKDGKASEIAIQARQMVENNQEVPAEILAAVVKSKILQIKGEVIDKQKALKEDQESNAAGLNEDDKGKKGAKANPKNPPAKGKGGKEDDAKDKDNKKGKGKDDSKEDGDDVKGKAGMKRRAKLKRKTDKVSEGPTHIDDEPTDGPDAYIIVQHFCSQAFVKAAAKLNMNFDVAVQLSSRVHEQSKRLKKKKNVIPEVSEEPAKESGKENAEGEGAVEASEEQEFAFCSKQPCLEFWDDLDEIIHTSEYGDAYKDMVYLNHSTDKLDGSPREPTTFFTALAQSFYTLVSEKKIFGHFLNNLKIIDIPEVKIHSEKPLEKYLEYVSKVPEETLSVPLIMDGLLGQLDYFESNGTEEDKPVNHLKKTCDFLKKIDVGFSNCLKVHEAKKTRSEEIDVSRISTGSEDTFRSRTPVRVHRHGDSISKRTLSHTEDIGYIIAEAEERMQNIQNILPSSKSGMPSSPTRSLKERIVLKESIDQLFEAESACVDRTLIQFKFEDMLTEELSSYQPSAFSSRINSARKSSVSASIKDGNDVTITDEAIESSQLVKESSVASLSSVKSSKSVRSLGRLSVTSSHTAHRESSNADIASICSEEPATHTKGKSIVYPRGWNFSDRCYAEYFNKRQFRQVLSNALLGGKEMFTRYYEEDDVLLIAVHSPSNVTEVAQGVNALTNELIKSDAVNIITPVGFRDFHNHILRNNVFDYPLVPPHPMPEAVYEEAVKEQKLLELESELPEAQEAEKTKEEGALGKKDDAKSGGKKTPIGKEKEGEKEKGAEKKSAKREKTSLKKADDQVGASATNINDESLEQVLQNLRNELEQKYAESQKVTAYGVNAGVLRYHFDEHYFYDANGVTVKSLKTMPIGSPHYCQFSVSRNNDFLNAYMFHDPALVGKGPDYKDCISGVFNRGISCSVQFETEYDKDWQVVDYSFASVILSTEEGMKIECRKDCTVEQRYMSETCTQLAPHRKKILETPRTEEARQYTGTGIVIKHLRGGGVMLLYATGKTAVLNPENGDWLCTDIDGKRMNINSENEVQVIDPIKVCAAKDPQNGEYLVYREDNVKFVVKDDGVSVCEHADGTVITCLYQEEESTLDNKSESLLNDDGESMGGELKQVESGVNISASNGQVNANIQSGPVEPADIDQNADPTKTPTEEKNEDNNQPRVITLSDENATDRFMKEVFEKRAKNKSAKEFTFKCNGYIDTSINTVSGSIFLDFNRSFYVSYNPAESFSLLQTGESELRINKNGIARYKITDSEDYKTMLCDNMALDHGSYIINFGESTCGSINNNGINQLAGFTHRAKSRVSGASDFGENEDGTLSSTLGSQFECKESGIEAKSEESEIEATGELIPKDKTMELPNENDGQRVEDGEMPNVVDMGSQGKIPEQVVSSMSTLNNTLAKSNSNTELTAPKQEEIPQRIGSASTTDKKVNFANGMTESKSDGNITRVDPSAGSKDSFANETADALMNSSERSGTKPNTEPEKASTTEGSIHENISSNPALSSAGETDYYTGKKIVTDAGEEKRTLDVIKFLPDNEPRLFIVWDNATGLELLKRNDAEKYLKSNEDEQDTIILKDNVFNQSNALCYSVVKKHINLSYTHSCESLFSDMVLPPCLSGFRKQNADSKLENLNMLELPKCVYYRQIYYYEPLEESSKSQFLEDYRSYCSLLDQVGAENTTDFNDTSATTLSHTFLARAYPHHDSSSTEILHRYLEETARLKEERLMKKIERDMLRQQEILYKKRLQHQKLEEEAAKHIQVSEGPDPDPLPRPVKAGSTSYHGHIPKYFDSLEGRIFLEEIEQAIQEKEEQKRVKEEESQRNDLEVQDEEHQGTTKIELGGDEKDKGSVSSSDSESSEFETSSIGKKEINVKAPLVGLDHLHSQNPTPVGSTNNEDPLLKSNPNLFQMRRRSSVMNVAGELRKVPIRPPKAVTGYRPQEEENSRFQKVEEPVRRKVRISSTQPSMLSISGKAGKVNTTVYKPKATEPKSQTRGFLMLNPRINFGDVVEGYVYKKEAYLRNCGMEKCSFKVNRKSLPDCIQVSYPLGAVAAGLLVKISIVYTPRLGENEESGQKVKHEVEIITESHTFKIPISAVQLRVNEVPISNEAKREAICDTSAE